MVSILWVFVLGLGPGGGVPQPTATLLVQSQDKRLLVNFESRPLIEVVKWMSEKTGRNYIVKDSLRDRPITIVSATRVSLQEAHRAFLQALQAEGLEVEKSGKFIRIAGKVPAGTATPVDRRGCQPVTGVSQLDERTWLVERTAFARQMDNATCLAKQARLVPALEGGKPVGFKLFAIRPDTLFDKLGFRNGDTITKINGHPITTPDQALQVYTLLKKARAFRVELKRHRKHRVHTYRIGKVKQ